MQFNQKEIEEFIPYIYSFLTECYRTFFDAVMQEIPKETYVYHRFYTLSVYQQYFKDSPESSFSCAFIDVDKDLNSMPDRIQVLLVSELKSNDGNSVIRAMNCPFDRIYVTDSSDGGRCIGEYVTEKTEGEDSLIKFRTYSKICYDDRVHLAERVLTTEGSNDTFYHNNHFVKLFTKSDDESFLKLSLLKL